MNVSFYHIQNVVKAYGQRTGRLRRLGNLRLDGPYPGSDVISISPEAKRKQIAETVAADVVSRARGQDPADLRKQQEIVDRLDAEPWTSFLAKAGKAVFSSG